MPWGQVEVLHSQNNGYFYIPFASNITWRGHSDSEGTTNFTHCMTGTFVYIKLGYLQNFMKNKCSMKCL